MHIDAECVGITFNLRIGYLSDTKNSVGLVGCIEEVSHNAIAVYWNPLESSAKVSVVRCTSKVWKFDRFSRNLYRQMINRWTVHHHPNLKFKYFFVRTVNLSRNPLEAFPFYKRKKKKLPLTVPATIHSNLGCLLRRLRHIISPLKGWHVSDFRGI